MPKPDWLEQLNEDLRKKGFAQDIPWADFVKVENDWATGRETEDVAEDIAAGTHKHVKPVTAVVANA